MNAAIPGHKPRALVILFDDERKSLRFTDATAQDIAKLLSENFVGDLPLSEYVDLPPEVAEAKLGSAVFSFLEHVSGRPLGIRNYREEIEKELAHYQAALEEIAANGDPGANYLMYLECSGYALRHRSEAELSRATAYLQRAADLGHAKAIDELDHGSILRAELLARMRPPDA